MFDNIQFKEMLSAENYAYNKRALKSGKFGQVPEGPGKLFTIHSANKWMEMERNTPKPQMLFGELWYTGELCVLFADTNAGKSILAVQIGNALAARLQTAPFGAGAPKCRVAYVDFELSATQFHSRYLSDYTDVGFTFDANFFRAEFNPTAEVPPEYKTRTEYMNAAMEHIIRKTEAEVLIIDNLSSLQGDNGLAKSAQSLMQHLKELKTRYHISILVLAHTPKRNPAKPITRDDLAGSKALMNFADSAFAIGESHQEAGLRYIKQIKQRHGQAVYHAGNVCMFRIIRDRAFLQFEFTGFDNERDHLYRPTPQDEKVMASRVAELYAKNSQRTIAARLGISPGKVNYIIKYLIADGVIQKKVKEKND